MKRDLAPGATGLLCVRRAMGSATDKFMLGGRPNPKLKPVTLRRADYERQKDATK